MESPIRAGSLILGRPSPRQVTRSIVAGGTAVFVVIAVLTGIQLGFSAISR